MPAFYRLLLLPLLMVAYVSVCYPQLSNSSAKVIQVTGATEYVHDPSIIKDGKTWYVFSTANGPDRKGELPVRCSTDLHQWKACGAVFASIPEWIKKESPET